MCATFQSSDRMTNTGGILTRYKHIPMIDRAIVIITYNNYTYHMYI